MWQLEKTGEEPVWSQWTVQQKPTEMARGLEHLSCDKRPRKPGRAQPGVKAQGDFTHVYKYPKRGCKDYRARLCSVAPSGSIRTRSGPQQAPPDHQAALLCSVGDGAPAQRPKGSGVSSLEIFSSHLDTALHILLRMALLLDKVTCRSTF